MARKFFRKKPSLFVLFGILLFFLVLSFLFTEKYFNCVTKDFLMCAASRKYTSTTGKFSFRYPEDYPVSYKTGSELKKNYAFEGYTEWVNFSNYFYPNAGGERLGQVVVAKRTDSKGIEEMASETLNNFDALPEQYKGVPPEIEYLKIAGKDAVRITRSQQPKSFNPPSSVYIFIHGEELYEIGFYYNDHYHNLPAEHYRKGSEIILSTFTLDQ